MTKIIPLSEKVKTDKQVENELEFYWISKEDVSQSLKALLEDLKSKLCICNEPFFDKMNMRCLFHDMKIDETFKQHMGDLIC